MNRISTILLATAIATCALSSCKKEDAIPSQPSNSATFVADGLPQNIMNPVTDTMVTDPSVPAMSWTVKNNRLTISAIKVQAKDTMLLLLSSTARPGLIGSYDLSWNGTDAVQNPGSPNVRCYYGRLKDLKAAFAKPVASPGHYVNEQSFYDAVEHYSGTGTMQITFYQGNQISGNFSFSSFAGYGSRISVTNGNFNQIKKLN